MARNREKRGSLVFQLKQELDSKLAIGQSKHADKHKGLTANKIYSWETYRTYLKHDSYFLKWAKTEYEINTIAEAKKHVMDFLEYRKKQGLSTYTLKLEVSALEKLYNMGIKDMFDTGDRLRINITRSREKVLRDKHFSVDKNHDLIEFCKSTGLRRAELKALRGNKLRINDDGSVSVVVDTATKGGRHRIIPVVHNVELVKNLMQKAGDDKVFSSIHNAADIHSYRAFYCSEVYKLNKRSEKNIPKEDKYVCRKDKKGTVYDKQAMLIASKALGHNRISVIAGHYLND